MVTLATVKEYLKISYDDEDNFIQICIDTAFQYLRNSIDDFDNKYQNDKFQKMADFILYPIIQDMFDNRTFSTGGVATNVEKYKILVNSIIIQLQYCTFA